MPLPPELPRRHQTSSARPNDCLQWAVWLEQFQHQGAAIVL